MEKFWFPLRDIPAQGAEYVLNDQSIWTGPIEEFRMSCGIVEPLAADVSVLPQEEGLLIRGRLTGTVTLPCNRCADDATIRLDQKFETFEPYPAGQLPGVTPKQAEDLDLELDSSVLRPNAHGFGMEVNLAALAWQEFSLALPVKPLCSEACQGLCPVCGAKKGACVCRRDEGDPRLALLRGIKIK